METSSPEEASWSMWLRLRVLESLTTMKEELEARMTTTEKKVMEWGGRRKRAHIPTQTSTGLHF